MTRYYDLTENDILDIQLGKISKDDAIELLLADLDDLNNWVDQQGKTFSFTVNETLDLTNECFDILNDPEMLNLKKLEYLEHYIKEIDKINRALDDEMPSGFSI